MATTSTVQTPSAPLAILSAAKLFGNTQKLIVNQHDDSPTGRDFTISHNDNQLFTVQAHVATNAFQRTFKEASSDQPALELRRRMNSLKGAWYAETPDPSRTTVLTADMKASWAHTKIDVSLQNSAASADAAPEVREVKLEVRGKDIMYKETKVLLDGRSIVHVKKVTGTTMPVVPFLNSNRTGSRDTWEVDVAEGVDLALVSALCEFNCYGDMLTLG